MCTWAEKFDGRMQMRVTHRFAPQRQMDGHDTTHDPAGMPIAPGMGPFILRSDGQRMEVGSV